MKIKIFPFETELICDETKACVLEIEYRGLFASIVYSIYQMLHGEHGNEQIVLVEESGTIHFEKDVVLISDILQLDLNSKQIMSKLWKRIEVIIAQEPELNYRIEESIAQVTAQVVTLLEEFPFDFSYTGQAEIASYLKMISLKIDEQKYKTHLEKLLAFFDIVAELNLCRFVILVNSKCYFANEKLQEIYKYARYKKIPLLLIEPRHTDQTIAGEYRVVIDEDYDEIIYDK
ncbi:MAG: type II-A CRISPR-associated protein Csn2 [Desulfitobacteriaceae bacterium]